MDEAAGDPSFSRRRSSFPVVNQTRSIVYFLQEWVCFPVFFGRPTGGNAGHAWPFFFPNVDGVTVAVLFQASLSCAVRVVAF